MKVSYHSALIKDKELDPDSVFSAVPGKARLSMQRERGDQDVDISLNGRILESGIDSVEIEAAADLVIRTQAGKHTYSVKPLADKLSNEYATAFMQFHCEYLNKPDNELKSIIAGDLKLYAVDQSTKVFDWTETFQKVENAFIAFKVICEKPKSHLKAVNEVRAIETVKRLGYEAIPYLAAHSEDWLARTASGLKPARLFSRVEDDEFQIYENRVVKTLIDLILAFLRKKEKELRNQYGQLESIMNSSVQTESFGFDCSFQKAVAELFRPDERIDGYSSKQLELAERLHGWSKRLLAKYQSLRATRLYRYLKRAKAVPNPLNETNILLMDKHYNVVFTLWKEIHKLIAPQQKTEEEKYDITHTCDDYSLFCKALCGFTAHVLNFEIIEDGLYFRQKDNLELAIEEHNGLISVTLVDRTKRTLTIPDGLQVPIAPGEESESFCFDGKVLSWSSTASVNEIDRFCSLFKTRESRSKEQTGEQKRRRAIKLKQAIDQRQREYPSPHCAKAIICPAAVELKQDSRSMFKEHVIACAGKIAEDLSADYVVIALPRCNEDEQRIIEYAKYESEKALILPLTMFDINSFRRLQNVFLRMILSFENGRCPSCGVEGREKDNQRVCDNCNQLMLTKTICPIPDCKHTFYYLSYAASADTILKMQHVNEDKFYQVDSLYQYKDVVPMSVKSGKLRTICPHCHK